MKFLVLGCLLFILNYSYVQAEASEECTKEAEKYAGCFDNINLDSLNNFDNTQSISKFCSTFDNNSGCKSFIDDITVSKSSCLYEGNDNISDLLVGLIYSSIKITYSAYCAKGKDGKLCPFSEYLSNSIEEITEATNNNNSTDLSDEGRKALAKDCRDSKCHDRLVAIKEIAEVLEKTSDDDENKDSEDKDSEDKDSSLTDSSNELINKYYTDYLNNKCDAIDGALSINKISFSFFLMIIFSLIMLI